MTGARAIAVVAGAILAMLVVAGAASYGAQSAAPDGPATVGEWAARSVRPPGPLPTGRGEQLVNDYGCRLCHVIGGPGGGAGGRVGPDLRGVGSRKTRAEIIEWLEDPQKIKPGTKMPTYPMSEMERHILADYLGSFR